jgi:hypothetical protein
MTDAAVTQGTFADFRLIKGRKVCQLVIEVPIEQADQALAALGGLPQPMNETWVALARLETKAKVQPIRPDNTKLSFEASKRCRDTLFQSYLKVSNEAEAAEAVRRFCGISSRAGLNTDPEAAKAWRALDAQFLAWGRGAA